MTAVIIDALTHLLDDCRDEIDHLHKALDSGDPAAERKLDRAEERYNRLLEHVLEDNEVVLKSGEKVYPNLREYLNRTPKAYLVTDDNGITQFGYREDEKVSDSTTVSSN